MEEINLRRKARLIQPGSFIAVRRSCRDVACYVSTDLVLDCNRRSKLRLYTRYFAAAACAGTAAGFFPYS